MPAKSLLQLATATAVKHHKELHDIGDLPYAIIRPILQKIDNPEKLHSLEVRSPHITEGDKEIWLEFIKRDIPQWEQYELPEKTNQWYGVYRDLQEHVQKELDADAEKLKLAIDGIQSERARLNPKIIPGPRGKHISGERATVRRRIPQSTRVDMSSGSKKNSIFAPQRRNNVLAVPTKHLNSRASQVRRAPRGLVEEHLRPAEQPASQRSESMIRSPRDLGRSRQQKSANAVAPGALRSEGEKRLLAFTSSKPVSTSESSETPRSIISKKELPTQNPRKRVASSPPPTTARAHPPLSPFSSASQSGSSSLPPTSASTPTTTSPARPMILRKRPVDPFLRPKKRRMD